ncbi:MAG: FKBP-type peptidyl-prolyl cis-trans isomerase [Treponema sp.]|jgi:FKBP-type peptidyl-prolyl cis-trans isomerase|nr:FKBP-type peptidyl-prolyl cis-trans isomerase [Treponema sp.]
MSGMKKLLCAALFAALAGLCFAEGVGEKVTPKGDVDTSYVLGMILGEDLKDTGLALNYRAFAEGLAAAMEGGTTRFTLEEAAARASTAIRAARAAQAQTLAAEEEAFLAAKAAEPGVAAAGSGLLYEELTPGEGESPTDESVVIVRYTGTFRDGTVFDGVAPEDAPAEFALYEVIEGWAEGLKMMKPGGRSRLYIPSALGYGPEGIEGFIPAYSTLIFEVELVGIKDAPAGDAGAEAPPDEVPEVVDSNPMMGEDFGEWVLQEGIVE